MEDYKETTIKLWNIGLAFKFLIVNILNISLFNGISPKIYSGST